MADEDENVTTTDEDVDDTSTSDVVDDATADTADTDATSDNNDDDASSGEDADDDASKPSINWKAMARKWEKRAKENARKASENAEAQRRLNEASNTDKTEVDRLRESIEALQAENAANKLKAARAEISRRTGVPVELLTATTEEELNDQADAISEFVAANAPKETAKTTNGTKPKEKLRSGAQGGKSEKSREEILAAVLGKGRKRATIK